MPPNARSYVVRPADRAIMDALLRGEFCYVLTSRQMGKSSLMIRTTNRLRSAGLNSIVLDLTAIGTNVTPDQWYGGLLARMGRLLDMEDELEDFWNEAQRLGPLQRLMAALHDVILARLQTRPGSNAPPHSPAAPEDLTTRPQSASSLVIFVDEIDVVRSLPFATDEFFAAIRECYNRRIEEPAFERLTFCLLGVATPSDLIRDPRTTPFNIGRRIELTDFSLAEAAPLLEGWQSAQMEAERTREQAQALLERVLYWTGGHPYLTQKLSKLIASNPQWRTSSEVDRLCTETFFSSRAREQEDNLLFVRERILRTELNLRELLLLYQRIWRGESVQDDETNPLIDALRLSGVIRIADGKLVVRNRIYHTVFDEIWITSNLPPDRRPEPGSIGVLPFRIVAADSSLEYLADGLTDELISGLGRVAGVRVASRTSAFQFKNKTDDVRHIGAQLMVQYILEGSLRAIGTDAQISAQLVHASNGHCLWSETYRHSQTDLVHIQDKIAGAIVDKLTSELGIRPRSAPVARPLENNEAYNLYLKGRFYWNRRTESAVRRSIELFQEAIQKNSGFALAFAGLADAFNILATYNYARPLDAYPKAKAAAIRALELDPELAPAHCALACSSAVHEWDWPQAERAFRDAIALNPSYATAHQWYAIYVLSPLGRHEEALQSLRRAQDVDPLSISITASIGLALYFAGRMQDAVAQCRQAVEMDPSFWIGQLFLGWACIQSERYEEAVEALQASLSFGNKDPVALAALAHAQAIMGRVEEAQVLLADLHHISQTRYVPAMDLVPVYFALNDTTTALFWLEQALQERSFKLIYLNTEPRLNAWRDHPRIQALNRQLGLRSAASG